MDNEIKAKDISISDVARGSAGPDLGKLYIVATPIGNLGDMSYRAVETLKNVSLIAAEDTRNSIKLLNHFEIRTPMTSYHEHNKYEKAEELIGRLRAGMDIAIITDAGTPCISDPGEVLIRRCREEGIKVTGVPGACAAINALTLSGFSSRPFLFFGFLPQKKQKKDRQAMLSRIAVETATMIMYEAPHHLKDTLKALSEVLGPERRVCLCREMTKRYEEVLILSLSEAMELEPRGEYVLVIEGRNTKEASFGAGAWSSASGGAGAPGSLTGVGIGPYGQQFSGREAGAPLAMGTDIFVDGAALGSGAELSIEEQVKLLMERGLSEKEAIKETAVQRGIPKREIYRAWHGIG